MLFTNNLMIIGLNIYIYLDKLDHDLRSRRHFQMMGIGSAE